MVFFLQYKISGVSAGVQELKRLTFGVLIQIHLNGLNRSMINFSKFLKNLKIMENETKYKQT